MIEECHYMKRKLFRCSSSIHSGSLYTYDRLRTRNQFPFFAGILIFLKSLLLEILRLASAFVSERSEKGNKNSDVCLQ